jgi:hypothetical protein
MDFLGARCWSIASGTFPGFWVRTKNHHARHCLMPNCTQIIPCNFVGSFKVGDNLVFNANLLCNLVEANKEGVFNKLVVLQVGSILEAALAEVIFMAQNFNLEGVPNISQEDQAAIAAKKVDKFNTVIDVLKKYKVLDGLGGAIYEELHKLRKYRNKVHIQDYIDIEGVPSDEVLAFSDKLTEWTVDFNSRVLKHLSEHLKRPDHLHGYVSPLVVPIPKVS